MVGLHVQLFCERVSSTAKSVVEIWRGLCKWIGRRNFDNRSIHAKVVTATLGGLTAPLIVFAAIEFGLSSFALMGTTEGLLFVFGPNIHFVYRIYSLYPWLIICFVVYAIGGVLYAAYLLSQLPKRISQFTLDLDPDSLFSDLLIGGTTVFLSWIILLGSNGGPIFGTVVSTLFGGLSLSHNLLSSLVLKLGIPSSSVIISLPITEAVSVLLVLLGIAKLFLSALRISNVLRLYGPKETLSRGKPLHANREYYSNLTIDSFRMFGQFFWYNLMVHLTFAVLVGILALVHLGGHILEMLF